MSQDTSQKEQFTKLIELGPSYTVDNFAIFFTCVLCLESCVLYLKGT